MNVYLLVAILVKTQFFGGPQVTVDSAVFVKAEDCYQAISKNQARLEKEYSQVSMSCAERKLNK